jgi:CRISPR-associated protein Cas2
VLTVVSYDIVDDRRRTRLANVLKDFGTRVQFSVFECRLDSGQLDILARRLRQVIDESKDSVRIYRICQECVTKAAILGAGELSEDPDVYVV